MNSAVRSVASATSVVEKFAWPFDPVTQLNLHYGMFMFGNMAAGNAPGAGRFICEFSLSKMTHHWSQA